ncbi:MAG TPA: hypothetical protein VND90_03005 [Terracidiphilus sp.]|nr:hypothetical protein [Terracidiphilus sp.]
MKTVRMGVFAPIPVVMAALALCAVPAARAQHSPDQMQGPPKYLYLGNTELKPGQNGEFAKLESEEIDALRAAKSTSHYFGMWSITGNTSRVLFFHGFDSYADLQKTHDEVAGNATLSAMLRKNNAAEGMMEASHHGSVYEFKKDLSLNPPMSLEKMRFADITLFKVRGGQERAFEHMVKVYLKAYASVPEARFVTFQKQYGEGSGTTYLLITPLESLAGVDAEVEAGKTFVKDAGPDLLAVLRGEGPSVIESAESNLCAFGAKISYVPDKWLTDSPDYWGKK